MIQYITQSVTSREIVKTICILDLVDEPKEKTMEELLRRQCKELEEAMEEEVNAFMTSWVHKKRMIRLYYSSKC